ncbi:MAG: hypothetical protein H7832_07640 [Magnetococcus sp. DMHC-6]
MPMVSQGAKGVLQVAVDGLCQELPCQVVHSGTSGLGVAILQPPENVGLLWMDFLREKTLSGFERSELPISGSSVWIENSLGVSLRGVLLTIGHDFLDISLWVDSDKSLVLALEGEVSLVMGREFGYPVDFPGFLKLSDAQRGGAIEGRIRIKVGLSGQEITEKLVQVKIGYQKQRLSCRLRFRTLVAALNSGPDMATLFPSDQDQIVRSFYGMDLQ